MTQLDFGLTKTPERASGEPFPAATCCVPEELRNLPALSIRQPWAWAIVTIGKDIENRCWPTKYRGRFLVHAAKGCTRDEYLNACDFIVRAVTPEYRGKGISVPGWKALARGGIVGVADLVDCVTASGSPWFMGQYGFVLRNVQPLPFVPCKGALGFFSQNAPDERSDK